MKIEVYESSIKEISMRGPTYEDYSLLHAFFKLVSEERKSGILNNENLLKLRRWFNGAMETTETMQGHVCMKPFGYDGDYLIIDKIYNYHKSKNPVYAKWDDFFHYGDAPNAVRNRKKYFINTLNKLDDFSEVLNIASGPCRDIKEFFECNHKKLTIDCIDIDKNAIQYAKNLLSFCRNGEVNFFNANVFKFNPERQYDLIWSAGLFDYFDDRTFRILLNRLTKFVKPKGSIVIGNFQNALLFKHYMEFGDWFLNYRDNNKLIELTEKIDCTDIFVESEELGVNLFLHLKFS